STALVKAPCHRPACFRDPAGLGAKERFRHDHALLKSGCDPRRKMILLAGLRIHRLSWLFDLALMEHLDFVGIRLAHLPQQVEGFLRFGLVDLTHRKADVDQYPITCPNAFLAHQRNIHIALDTGHVDFSDMIGIVNNLDNLARNTKAHSLLLVAYSRLSG